MGLTDECSQYFGCSTLYEVLSIDKDASEADVKKAYRKASLLLHPDKVKDGEKEEATRKFQTLSKVYYVLSDKDRRAFYDETGVVDGDSVPDDESPEFWTEYWRALFPRVTLQDIEDFYQKYTGSDEELKDLQECYEKHEGCMNRISDCFIGYRAEEEDRIRNIIEGWIEEGKVQAYPKFVNEKPAKKAARAKKAKREADEAKELMSNQALAAAMQRRAQDREKSFSSLMSRLEEKYCNEKPKGKRNKKMKRGEP